MLMKPIQVLAATAIILAGQVGARAQFAPGSGFNFGGPRFEAALTQLFGSNSAFNATLEIETKEPKTAEAILVPAKVSFLEGKSRLTIDMSQTKGTRLPQGAAAQLKTMGMADLVVISRPDKNSTVLIYPGLQGYVEQPRPEKEAAPAPSQIKVSLTDLGKEIVEGHACVKQKAMVIFGEGTPYEATVWRASDLKSFPVKVEMAGTKSPTTLTFKSVDFTKPSPDSFEAPKDFTRYDNPQSMLQQGMMRMLGGGK